MTAWSTASPPNRAAPLNALDVYAVGDRGTATGRLRVTADLPGLTGHFPGQPILPGVYLLEAAFRLLDHVRPEDAWSIRRLRFLQAVGPGEEVLLAAGPGRGDEVKVVATVAGTSVATLTFAPASTTVPEIPPPVCANAVTAIAPLALLPQRWPLLLVDRVCGHVPGRSLCARKALSLTDPVYAAAQPGWTPTQLAYPTSLLVESFGQAAALLALSTSGAMRSDEVLMLAAASGVTTFAPAGPGATLHHQVTLERADAATMVARGSIWACATLVATVDQLIAVRRERR